MFEAVTWRRLKVTVSMIAAVAAAVWIYEFRILRRPVLGSGDSPRVASETAAPVFGLANVSFACAASNGFVTEVRVQGETAQSACSSGFTDATTRCPSSFPMMGFGEQIKCSDGESIHCTGGPLQALGLFKDDSFCGDVSDRDMGPPGASERSDD